MTATRRTLLISSAAAMCGAATPASARPSLAAFTSAEAGEWLGRYVAAGIKASGGPGDREVGGWMSAHLERAGFTVERQTFSAPFFEVAVADLSAGSVKAAVIPQAIVVPTPEGGVHGPLALRTPLDAGREVKGAVVLLQLPYNRWSTAAAPAISEPVKAAVEGGAAAVVIVTTGPTGDAHALNADGRAPMFPIPAATLGPRDAAAFTTLPPGTPATLRLTGHGGRREAYNLVGRLDRGRAKWLVVSTPRSGWFTCAGERGGGVAAWMLLSAWAAKADLPVNLCFTCNSGHEYENLGATHLVEAAAPPPEKTALWLALGANVAARDWHEQPGRLTPLPSADPQRYLMTSPALLPAARAAFAGLPGLEAPDPVEGIPPGELGPIVAAGYGSVAGIFGAHRFHHSPNDDARCIDPALAAAAAQAARRFILAVLG